MNWSKIKNIMIFILVAVNLFLIGDISFTRYASTSLPKGTGESFQTVLSKNGIELEGYLIPEYYETRRVINSEIYSVDNLSEIFFDQPVKYESDGQSVFVVDGDKKLVVSGISFEYTNNGQAVEKNGSDIISALKKLGISTSGARFVKEEGLLRVFVEDDLVEGIYLDVKLSDKGEVVFLKGVWPKVDITKSTQKVSVISSVSRICETIPSGSCIDRIEKIYVTKSDGKECSISPGWKISCEGKSYVVN